MVKRLSKVKLASEVFRLLEPTESFLYYAIQHILDVDLGLRRDAAILCRDFSLQMKAMFVYTPVVILGR